MEIQACEKLTRDEADSLEGVHRETVRWGKKMQKPTVVEDPLSVK